MTPSQPNAEIDAQRLLQDLQVHQIELEMQNEALLQTQSALQASKDRYVDLYEFAPVGYCTLSLDGLIDEINLTAVKLLGVERHDLLRRSFTNWVAPVDQLRWTEFFASAKGNSGNDRLELSMCRRDGSTFPAQLDCVVQPLGQGARDLRVAVMDITERKQAETLLLAAKAEAEAANQSKSRFLAAASHDLRQPMAALSLYAGMLGAAVRPGQDKLVSHVRSCVDSLSALLTDLLDVSKLDAGVVQPQVSEFSLASLCEPLLAIYRAKAELKGLQLRCRHDPQIHLRTDPQLLQRLIGNLLDNAVQYTAHGGVLIGARRHAGKLWVEVWDTGVGIPQGQTRTIFEEFRQLGDTARNRGTGLGLSIVAKTAALLSLQIRVHSRQGRGSMFAIELPECEFTGLPAVVSESVSLAPCRIGVVEDNPQVLQALELALQSQGHMVQSGASGAQLMAKLGSTAPDVVVSDYRLGAGETGFEVIEAVRARFGAGLPAIVLTGETDLALIRGMAAQGMTVICKPVPRDVLLQHIRAAMQRETP